MIGNKYAQDDHESNVKKVHPNVIKTGINQGIVICKQCYQNI